MIPLWLRASLDPAYRVIELSGLRTGVGVTRVDVWSGLNPTYPWPASPVINGTLSSSSAQDSAAGTGIQEVRIHYLDPVYNEQSVDYELNGTTNVIVTENLQRIQYIEAIRVGSTGAAVGNIDLINPSSALGVARIEADFNNSRAAVWTIPAGYVGKLVRLEQDAVITTADVEMYVRATCDHEGTLTPGIFHAHRTKALRASPTFSWAEWGLTFPAQCDLSIAGRRVAGASTATLAADLALLLIAT